MQLEESPHKALADLCQRRLLSIGAVLVNVSDAGSRYFDLPGGLQVRVSDHRANDATWAWMERAEVAEVRVDKADWLDQLEAITGQTTDATRNYFADYSAWSQSMCKTFLDRRRLAHAYYVERSAAEPSDKSPYRKGTALHSAILEPDLFAAMVRKWPHGLLSADGGIRSKEAKDYRDSMASAGMILLKDAEYDAVQCMAASVQKVCGTWLNGDAKKEHTIYWTDTDSGLPCKLRLDWWMELPESNIVIDLKTSADASPEGFRSSVKRFRYWFQDDHYSSGVTGQNGKPTEFYFAVVDVDFPHTTALYRIDEETKRHASEKRRRTLAEIAQCHVSGDWREPWEQDITPINLKTWEM